MQRVFIIAEAGVNHNGNIETAKKLIDIAVLSKADCVKFQTFITENDITKYAEKAEYQKYTTSKYESQFDMEKKLELSFDDFKELKRYCEQRGILFLSTPSDLDSIKFLQKINIPLWKIPSSDMNNIPYLIEIAKTQKPVIMSTGMASLNEIKDSIKILKEYGCSDIRLLHCNTEYPTPFEDVNLSAILTLKNEFGCDVGYSDHTLGIEAAIAAVAIGASIIEKHFTIDKNMNGPDHKSSLEPNELELMVKSIRNIELSIGNGEKNPSTSELKNINLVRKSIVAKTDICQGDIFTENNITTKRPGTGISAAKWIDVLGLSAKRNFKQDELIEL